MSETTSSGDVRLGGIADLIRGAKYSIHDLSRMQSTSLGELARLNMPFELGLDLGCQYYGRDNAKRKKLLILDKERYRYQQALSDLSGNDIAAHESSPEVAVRSVRNWLSSAKGPGIHSPQRIWQAYNEFLDDFTIRMLEEEFSQEDIDAMPISEYIYYIGVWLDS